MCFDPSPSLLGEVDYNAPSDFDALKEALTTRIRALLTKGETLRQIEEQEQVSAIEGLTQPELFILAEIAGSLFIHAT